jgi:energy-coupling factor transport system ATP-binding protein
LLHPVVQFIEVYFSYSNYDSWSLQNLNLNIAEGERVAVTGNNGSGKSTMAHLIQGLIMPLRGEVNISQKVGIVFQQVDRQYIGLTIEEDLAFGLLQSDLHTEEIAWRIHKILDFLDWHIYRKRDPATLSRKEKAILALAGVVITKPKVIVIDELEVGFSSWHEIDELLHKLLGVMGYECPVLIWITHNMESICYFDRVIVLHQGQMVFDGAPSRLWEHPRKASLWGLPLPIAVQLREKLRSIGCPLDDHILSNQQLARAIWKLGLKR